MIYVHNGPTTVTGGNGYLWKIAAGEGNTAKAMAIMHQ
jgi:hypothetical protein